MAKPRMDIVSQVKASWKRRPPPTTRSTSRAARRQQDSGAASARTAAGRAGGDSWSSNPRKGTVAAAAQGGAEVPATPRPRAAGRGSGPGPGTPPDGNARLRLPTTTRRLCLELAVVSAVYSARRAWVADSSEMKASSPRAVFPVVRRPSCRRRNLVRVSKARRCIFTDTNKGVIRNVGDYDRTKEFSVDFWFFPGQRYEFQPDEVYQTCTGPQSQERWRRRKRRLPAPTR